jgi:hypothetical protein
LAALMRQRLSQRMAWERRQGIVADPIEVDAITLP